MAIASWIVDVTDPTAAGSPFTGLQGLQPGAGFGASNTTRLQLIINAAFNGDITTCRGILFFPPRLFELASTVTFPNTSSFHVMGGGGMVKGLSQMSAVNVPGNCTVLRWSGGNTGPMFRLQDTDGAVFECINFDGKRGPEKIGGGDFLDQLFRFERNIGNVGALFTHFKNCTWFRAQKLFYVGGSNGTAEITFSKCLLNCGDEGTGLWDSIAYYNENPQSVNVVFDSNCEFNNCGYCVYTVNSGRVVLAGPTITQCGTILARQGGSQNVNGDRIDYCHIDGGSGSEGRKQLYKSSGTTTSHGSVVIETPKYGSLGSQTDEFAEIASFSGTTLTLTNPLRMRAGDKVAFFEQGDLINANGGKIETTILSRSSDTLYATTQTAASLGFSGDIEDNYYATFGEALIECVSSDFVHLRNCQLSPEHIWGGRLARLTSSVHSGGRCPKFHAQNVMCEWGVDFNESGLQSLLTMTGTTWWRFENAARLAGTQEPITVGNFGVFEGGGSGDTLQVFNESRVVMREYGQAGIEMFELRDPDTGQPVAGLSFVDGDVTWYADGASQGNTTTVPVSVGGGIYALNLTADERTAQQAIFKIADQTAPATWIPLILTVDLYGHANARHKLNLNETNVKSNVKQVDDDANAAPRLKRAARSMFLGTVGSGSSVSSVVTSSLDPAPTSLNQIINRVILFAGDTTTAALRGQAADVTGSTVGGILTVSPALPTPPVSGDLFIVS